MKQCAGSTSKRRPPQQTHGTCRAQQQELHPGSGCGQPAERSRPSTWTRRSTPGTLRHPASRAMLPPCPGRLGGRLPRGLFCAFYICFACRLTGGFSRAKDSPGCAGAVSRAWGVLLGKSSPQSHQHSPGPGSAGRHSRHDTSTAALQTPTKRGVWERHHVFLFRVHLIKNRFHFLLLRISFLTKT